MKKYIILIIIGVLIIYCGKRTPPLSIEESIPKDVHFEISLTPKGANLFIYLPTKTRGDYPLVKIKKLIIEKKEMPLNNPKGKVKKKYIKLSPKLHSAGNLIIYSDYKLKNRYQYTYRIRVVKDFLVKTPWTEPITIFWHNPPNFPQDFKILTLGENALLLTWQKPKTDIYGNPLNRELRYKIEKFYEEKKEIIETTETKYFDKVKSSQKVCYRIWAVLNFRGTFIPGIKTPIKCIIPK